MKGLGGFARIGMRNKNLRKGFLRKGFVRVCHLVVMVVCIVDLVSLPVKQVWLGKDDETAVTVGFGA